MSRDWVGMARRGLRKPPRVLARRLADEARVEAERYLAPRRAGRLREAALLARHRAESVEELWERLAARPYLAATAVDPAALETVAPGERARVEALAGRAARREVDLLGSGATRLPTPVDWHTDFKTGRSWPLAWARGIDYANLGEPSDVKVPWELSRLQWLLPAAQAHLLDGDERHAATARTLLDEWIAANPYGRGVNWAVAMEPALRVLSWTYLFHAFARSAAWADPAFRLRFLTALHLHVDWVDRHVERSDVNGNHYAADAAGIASGGLFFDERGWADRGWAILVEELPRQVYADGVDFEGSLAYHRLVAELFLLPALYRTRLGLDVPDAYRRRLAAMALVSAYATRDDGTTPLLGDADDARALPLGGQPLGDHRYLAGLVAAAWDDADAREAFAGPRSEVAWLLGPDAAAALPDRDAAPLGSAAFPEGGLYVLRGPRDHVLVDCGPVGLAGRGGHGHDDCLSFEAWLDGVLLVSDPGCYVYTADPEWRDRLRATAAHSTPLVDGEEQNRFTGPLQLWTLHYDAVPEALAWRQGADVDLFRGAHAGYRRLAEPATPVRTVALDRRAHALAVRDELQSAGLHDVRVPFQLAPGVVPELRRPGLVALASGGRRFAFAWSDPDAWELHETEGRVAPSYGVLLAARRLELRRSGPPAPLLVSIAPGDDPAAAAAAVAAVEAA